MWWWFYLDVVSLAKQLLMVIMLITITLIIIILIANIMLKAIVIMLPGTSTSLIIIMLMIMWPGTSTVVAATACFSSSYSIRQISACSTTENLCQTWIKLNLNNFISNLNYYWNSNIQRCISQLPWHLQNQIQFRVNLINSICYLPCSIWNISPAKIYWRKSIYSNGPHIKGIFLVLLDNKEAIWEQLAWVVGRQLAGIV